MKELYYRGNNSLSSYDRNSAIDILASLRSYYGDAEDNVD